MCQVRRSQLVAVVKCAGEGSWCHCTGLAWKRVGGARCSEPVSAAAGHPPTGNRLSLTVRLRDVALGGGRRVSTLGRRGGKWVGNAGLAALRVSDKQSRTQSCALPPGGRSSAATFTCKVTSFHLRMRKSTQAAASFSPPPWPDPAPGFGQEPSGMVTLPGSPRLSNGSPREGLARSQPPLPARATESTEHFNLNILLFLYSMYRIYSIR